MESFLSAPRYLGGYGAGSLFFIRLKVYDMGLDEYWVTPRFIFGLILGCEALYGMGGAWGCDRSGIRVITLCGLETRDTADWKSALRGWSSDEGRTK